MKQKLVLIFFIVCSTLFALKFEVVSFNEVPGDFKAQMEPISDNNQSYCSVIKIESEIANKLSFKQKIFGESSVNSNEKYFYISSTETQITLQANNFEPLTIDAPASGFNSGSVYYLKLNVIKEVLLNLTVTPQPDRIILNDKIVKLGNIKVLPGNYKLQIEKDGYDNITQNILIDNQNAVYNFALSKSQTETVKVEKAMKVEETAVDTIQPAVTDTGETILKLNRFGIIFEVISVEMFEKTLTINMEITSTKDDRNLSLIHYYTKFHTRIFDNFGNEYQPNRLSIANNSKTSTVTNYIVQNIKTPATLIFNNINSDATKLPLFDLGVTTDNYDSFRVKYRNLEIKKID